MNFTRPFCQNHGVILSDYIYETPYKQRWYNDYLNREYDRYVRLGVPKMSRFFKVDNDMVIKCVHASVPLLCHYHFPSCEATRAVYKEQTICRETCLNLIRICGEIWDYFAKAYTHKHPDQQSKKRVLCELQPYRNAGESPECWYSDLENSTVAIPSPQRTPILDCLYLNGSSYHGNISVTASGIPCQSWTEQCPHRHTMNTMYPELNNAKNYCRNPKNSGQRPWCFTTDRNKRWEYCDIPKCTPVHGNYGNWSLSSPCNVTCGEGFETWTRNCNNPEPKFDGTNCSHLGEAIEYRPCQTTPCPGKLAISFF
ncbi:plasminogen-like [Dendronephthya gigantea]|uniref:plasminogen-like n=1 Tax=Dendronephthya gigantea TaxID=151771 RepID=UPI00106B9229|nr:plasminogen-like [Dendronephthya gigantea]